MTKLPGFGLVTVLLTVTVMEKISTTKGAGNDDTSNMSDEKRLIKQLLSRYENVGVVGRPVQNQSETIRVYYGLSLIQILDLDEKNQILTTNVWSRYHWVDNVLKWNVDEFGGVSEVRVPKDKIWTPDIVLYNYADTRLQEQREVMAVVDWTGSVTWMPPAIYKSTCTIDITNFPFDVQRCNMKFGSWTYDGWKLDIMFYENQSSVNTKDYTRSNEWKLLGAPAVRNVQYYTGLSAPYPDLTFSIEVQRVAVFHKYILVLPCVLLSFLTLVIFWLPPESPAKVMLGMGVFVAFFVLLLLLADSTPPASQSIPLMGAYFCMNMILITLSTFLAILIIQTHIRGDRKNKVPPWLKRIAIDGMARVLCMTEFLDPEPPKPHTRTDANATANAGSNGRRASGSKQLQQQQQPLTNAGCSGRFDIGTGSRSRSTSSSRTKDRSGKSAGGPTETKFAGGGGSGVGGGGGSLARGASKNAEPAPNPDRSPVYAMAPSGFGSASVSAAAAVGLNNPSVENDIREIRRLLKAYMVRVENKDAAAKATKEWRIVARVMDRLFFFCYIGAIVVSLFTIFPRDHDAGPEITGDATSVSEQSPADEPIPGIANDYNN